MMDSNLAELLLEGNRKAVSRAITIVENREKGYSTLLKRIYTHTGGAFVIGVTGPPGTGKSSLVDQLVRAFRARKSKVAVLAVDPTSPVSGGAMLGDRVRMLNHALDEGVYIRSMASRGDEGGLSRAAKNTVRILDAAGNDIIFVETVGIGQAEVEIVKVADAILVVLMPELGDEVQAIKAGLMEIGDIFVVNKSDLPGADRIIYNINPILTTKSSGWKQKALTTSSKTGAGLDELVLSLLDFKEFLADAQNRDGIRREKVKNEIIDTVALSIVDNLKETLSKDPLFLSLVDRVNRGEEDPESAAESMLKDYTVSSRDSKTGKGVMADK
jgi:GTPase